MAPTLRPCSPDRTRSLPTLTALSAPIAPMAPVAKVATVVMLAAALLAGCAVPTPSPDTTLPAYAQPEASQPHARLLLRAAVGPADRFALVLLEDNAQCKSPKLLTRGSPQQAAAPVRLAAGQPTTLDFVVVRGGGAPPCGLRWTFQPQAGKTYLVAGGTVGGNCGARLLDATVADRPDTPPDLVLRVAPGNNCVPLAQAQRVPSSLIQGGQHNGDAVLNPRATTQGLEGLIKP